MTEEFKVNMKNVRTIAQTFHKCLAELQKMGIEWNLAEIAVAVNELLHEYLLDLEKQKRKGMAM